MSRRNSREPVSGRAAALILLGACGAGLLFALATSPGLPKPRRADAKETVTVVQVVLNEATEDGP